MRGAVTLKLGLAFCLLTVAAACTACPADEVIRSIGEFASREEALRVTMRWFNRSQNGEGTSKNLSRTIASKDPLNIVRNMCS